MNIDVSSAGGPQFKNWQYTLQVKPDAFCRKCKETLKVGCDQSDVKSLKEIKQHIILQMKNARSTDAAASMKSDRMIDRIAYAIAQLAVGLKGLVVKDPEMECYKQALKLVEAEIKQPGAYINQQRREDFQELADQMSEFKRLLEGSRAQAYPNKTNVEVLNILKQKIDNAEKFVNKGQNVPSDFVTIQVRG